jgi:hypothetical protein
MMAKIVLKNQIESILLSAHKSFGTIDIIGDYIEFIVKKLRETFINQTPAALMNRYLVINIFH